MKTLNYIITIISITILFSCSARQNETDGNLNTKNSPALMTSDLRPLTQNESLEDFEQLVTLIKKYYGPLEFKTQSLNLKLDEMVRKTQNRIKNSQDEDETVGHMMSFISQFKDGHFKLSIPFTSSGIVAYRIPILLTAAEDKMIIFDHKLTSSYSQGIQKGDIVLSIDGLSYKQILRKINLYLNLGNDETNAHLIVHAFNRPAYMTELKPSSKTSTVVVHKADGTMTTLILPWATYRDSTILSVPSAISNNSNSSTAISNSMTSKGSQNLKVKSQSAYESELNYRISNNSMTLVGDTEPFFFNPTVEENFKTERVSLSDQSQQNLNLSADDLDIFAIKYDHNGKKILLIRNGSYVATPERQETILKYYSELLKENEATSDVLVIDQTNNPGGSYCQDFYKLFITQKSNNVLHRFNVDRMNLDLLKRILKKTENTESDSVLITKARLSWSLAETANDNNEDLTPPISEDLVSTKLSPATYTWKKPILVVSNELSMSCADMFALLMKKNNTAKIFGQRTAGLGGNVEPVGSLLNSNFQVNLTRSIYQIGTAVDSKNPFSEVIENKGVEPDYKRAVRVDDIKNDFVDYFKELSDRAIEQIH